MRPLALLLALSLLSTACAQGLREVEVYPLPLAGDWAEAEFSGLAWHGDRLVLLPQYPERYAPDAAAGAADGALWALDRDALREAVDEALDGDDHALRPRPVPFYDGGLSRDLEGFEGYEAIAFAGDTVFVTIEARDARGMQGYLARGRVDGAAVRLDPRSLVRIPAPVRDGRPLTLANMSYEALVLAGGRALVFYEANGGRLSDHPEAVSFYTDARDSTARAVPFPTLEYRVTDATRPDGEGRFWVINTFWPGDAIMLAPVEDALAVRYGKGWTHERSPVVERLVELQATDAGVVPVPRPPVSLRLLPGGVTRNWEGIAPFEGGFVLVTDSYPDTRLGYVRLRGR